MDFTAGGLASSRPSRLIGVGFVVTLHALLIWALVRGSADRAAEPSPPPIETRIIEEAAPPAAAPAPPPRPDFVPPPPPTFTLPPLDIAPPPPAPPSPATQAPQTPAITAAPPGPIRQILRVAPKLDLRGSPLACTRPAYPAASERLGEAGTSAISLLIGADGKIEQIRVDRSSGFPRLDEATIRAFSRCNFFVGTTDGVPEASWFSIRYKWVVPK